MFNPQEAIAAAAKLAPNMNEAQGGGDFQRELPAEGLCRLRLTGYIELGQHEQDFKGEKKLKDRVALTFELSGPRHQPMKIGEVEVPHTITITEALSLNEKANFFKLFKRLNHTGEFTHFAQLLNGEFIGNIHHNVVGEGDNKKTYANLRGADGYTIRPPFTVNVDAETGEETQIRLKADPAKAPLKCFLWNFPSKEMWDSLFIDGKWDDQKDKDGKVIKEGTSKNYWQNRIKAAKNFKGSPMAEILFAGGEPDLPGAETPERSEENQQAAADATAGATTNDDPLAGV